MYKEHKNCINRIGRGKLRYMKISVITICYNNERGLRKTIESVLRQDYSGAVEYLIIDGASTDGSVAVAESYRKRFAEKGYEYRIISEPDRGIYDAMNKGIRSSSGDIIGIINSGDWYRPYALRYVAAVYEKTAFDLFHADINLIRQNGSVIVKRSRYDRIVSSRHWNHPTSFVAKKVYDEMGLFRCEGIHDDFDFYLRVRRAGKKIVIRNRVLACFRVGGASNQKSLSKCLERIMDRYRAYRNNGYSRLYMIECLAMEAAKWILQ